MNEAKDNSNIIANRKANKWSRRALAGRILWSVTRPLFSLSPRIFWGWRRAILRVFGASIGEGVHIHPSVQIEIPWNISIGEYSAIGDRVILYALGPIRIGNRTTVSQGAHLCAGTHDWRDPELPLLKQQIGIGDDVWVCADAFVSPDVSIGHGSIVGARAVVTKDVPDNIIVAGNPARLIRKLIG